MHVDIIEREKKVQAKSEKDPKMDNETKYVKDRTESKEVLAGRTGLFSLSGLQMGSHSNFLEGTD